MQSVIGKRFIFGVISILAVSVVTVLLKFDGETYLKLIGLNAGVYTASQTITDSKKINERKNDA